MSTDSTSENRDGREAAPSAPMPLAADRPVVDGTHQTAEEIRAELAKLLEEDRQRVEELVAERAVVAQPVVPDPDVPAPVVAEPAAGPDPVLRPAGVREAVQEKASVLRGTAQDNPGVFAGAAIALVLVLLAWRLLGRR